MHWCAEETFMLVTFLSMLPGVRYLIQRWFRRHKTINEGKCALHAGECKTHK